VVKRTRPFAGIRFRGRYWGLKRHAIFEEVRIGVNENSAGFRRYRRNRHWVGVANRPVAGGQLLLNEELADITIPVTRVTGLALIGMGLACWPGPPILGMLVYSTLVMLYLAYIGFVGDFVGVFLWPAVLFHAGLSILLAAFGWPQRWRKE
jgi:hypothetical protein